MPIDRKVFILDVRIEGKSRRIALGQYGPLTLNTVRKLASADIALGRDPTARKYEISEAIKLWSFCK